jgi:Rrf2 family iron-sulfur cluster assembly transcriptional regulator|tara:strand:+ start:177 stop:659 length:483 start_codon:yes stop_codon:yes gene_type:complete
MKLSTKARHAITAMMDLALNDKVRPVTLAEISNSQGISLSYLEQLFAKLRKSGLVIGVRGPGGGYKLSRVPGEISIAQIIFAIDEYRPQMAEAVDIEPSLEKKYVTHVLWDELSQKIYNFLNSITLAEFSTRPTMLDVSSKHSESVDNLDREHFSDRSAA